jgi:hypothetical protein
MLSMVEAIKITGYPAQNIWAGGWGFLLTMISAPAFSSDYAEGCGRAVGQK